MRTTRARETLVEELGLDPGSGLQLLQQQVLAQDPQLDWCQSPSTSAHRDTAPLADWRRNYVPAPTTTLIGGAAELARIAELMTKSRLVTLTGPGSRARPDSP